MKPAPFRYYAPKTTEEALDCIAKYKLEAKILAGGQSLIPAMNFRLAQPAILIDINRIPELSYIKEEGARIKIGCMTRHVEVERSSLVARKAPLLHETMPWIAHPQIRNRGTFGGSIVHADPAAELPAVAVAMDARFHLRKKGKKRDLSAKDFFVGLFTTALEPDEMLVEIEIPSTPPMTGWAFEEVSRRKGDFALVGVCALVTLDKKDVCKKARLVYVSVGEGPVDAVKAARILEGQKYSPELLAQVAKESQSEIDPQNDIHATSEYRRHLAHTLSMRALERAFQKAIENKS